MLGSKTRGGGQEESCHLKIPKRDQFRENITSFPRRTFSPFLPFFSSRKFAKKVGSSGPFFGFSKLIFFFSERWLKELFEFILIQNSKWVPLAKIQGFPAGSDGKEYAAMWETQVGSLSWKDPLEKGMARHRMSKY